MKWKKILATVLSVVMIGTMPAVGLAAEFTDGNEAVEFTDEMVGFDEQFVENPEFILDENASVEMNEDLPTEEIEINSEGTDIVNSDVSLELTYGPLVIEQDTEISNINLLGDLYIKRNTTLILTGIANIEGNVYIFGTLNNRATLTVTETLNCLRYSGLSAGGNYDYGILISSGRIKVDTLNVNDDYLSMQIPSTSEVTPMPTMPIEPTVIPEPTVTPMPTPTAIPIVFPTLTPEPNITPEVTVMPEPTTIPEEPYVPKVPSVEESKVIGFENPLVFDGKTAHPFTITGAGMDNTNPGVGDVRYVPKYWSTRADGSTKQTSWNIKSSKPITQDGSSTIYIFFEEQKYDGKEWKATGTIKSISKIFEIKAYVDSDVMVTPTVTPEPTVTPTPTPAHTPVISKVTDTVVKGLENPLIFDGKTTHPFTVIGAGSNITNPGKGDTRYVPKYWSMSAGGSSRKTSWRIGTPNPITRDATFTMYIFLEKYEYNGSSWVETGTIESISTQFRSKAYRLEPTPTPIGIISSENCIHSWNNGKVQIDSNCSETGIKTYTCAKCLDVKMERIPLKAHKFTTWTMVKRATALVGGKKERKCANCGHKESISIAKLKATGKLNMKTLNLKVKQSTTALKVTGLAYGDRVKSYSSSNKKIFTVNSKGKIYAKGKGTAKLTVTLASGKKLTATVKVQTGTVKTTKLTVNKKSITLKRKKSFQLKTTVAPLTSQEKVTYKSSKTSVATVNSKGKITAKKKGTAYITVKSGKKSVKVKVVVK